MKLNKIVLAGAVFFGITAGANATTGSITFKGQVMDTACSIDASDLKQEVDFGVISKSQLAAGGSTVTQPVEITLIGCSTGALNTASIEFNGGKGPNDTFGVSGQAQNIGVALLNNGTKIAPGTAYEHKLAAGNNTISLQAAVEGANDDTANPVVAGDFTSVANFIVSYK
ncbi:fimbrial protein [Serratia proteamaculans]|uniref:fimbrial protein n=1 Tax=Serratia proteamaculans TaxID=28151 RepID=UPI0039AFA26C